MWKNGRNDSRKIKTKKEDNVTEICGERQNNTSTRTHCVVFSRERVKKKTQ